MFLAELEHPQFGRFDLRSLRTGVMAGAPCGENISPREVEDLLREHPSILDVCVYGVPDEKYGEKVAAAVRLRPGGSIDAAAVAEFCEGRLARFKIPRHIHEVESFPMTASGKIQRYRLQEEHRPPGMAPSTGC